MIEITIVVGNPRPQSLTSQVAERYARAIFSPAPVKAQLFDLADMSRSVFDRGAEPVQRIREAIAASDLTVIASPTYKASYTGLLKAFLDQYPTDGLKGVVVLPLMTGGSLAHFLAPSVHLVPLLMELGAAVPVRPFYVDTSQTKRLDDDIGAAARLARETLATLSGICQLVSGLAEREGSR